MSKVLYFFLKEVTFVYLQSNSCFCEHCDYFVHVMDVVIQRGGVDHDVVDVPEACLPVLSSEDRIQGSLETGWSVGQTKRHTRTLEGSCVAYGCLFRSIFLA